MVSTVKGGQQQPQKISRYRPLPEARIWARQQNFKSGADFLTKAKLGAVPSDIPRNPHVVYQDWVSWPDFLGRSHRESVILSFKTYAEAKVWAREHKLQSYAHFNELRSKKMLPSDIPSNPSKFYKGEWVSWADFLGADIATRYAGEYLPYTEARAYVRSLGIKSTGEFLRRSKAGDIPPSIPRSPNLVYVDEWEGMAKFFGTDCEPGYKGRRTFRPYEAARQWAMESCIGAQSEWRALSKAGLLPADIPGVPPRAYKDEWVSWPVFFGVHRKGDSSLVERVIAHELSHFFQVEEGIREVVLITGARRRPDIILAAQKVIIEYDGAHWHKHNYEKDCADSRLLREAGWTVVRIRENPLPLTSENDISVESREPFHQRTLALLRKLLSLGILKSSSAFAVEQYAQRGRLYATSEAVLSRSKWRPFEEVRAFARTLGLTGQWTWRNHWKTSGQELPSDIPMSPDVAYRLDWISWADFLGVPPTPCFMTYAQARSCAHELGIRTTRQWISKFKEGALPPGAPGNPYHFFLRRKQWKDCRDFFGTKV